VRAQGVVVVDKLLEQIFEMNFSEDKEVIEAFPADSGDEAFGVGVHVGGAEWGFEDAESLVFEEAVEGFGEFGVAVADEDGLAGGRHVLGDGLDLLKDPVFVGVLGDAGDMDAAGFDVDKEQDVKGVFAGRGPDGLSKEVAGEEGVEGSLEGVGKRIFGTDAGDGNAVFNKDVFDGGFADGDFELFEFGENFGITPFGLACHGDDEGADVVGEYAGAAAFFCERLGKKEFTDPSAEGGVVDDGDNLFDPAAEGESEFEQNVFFSAGQGDVGRQMGTKDLVFGGEELELLDEVVMGHLGEKGEEAVVAVHGGLLGKRVMDGV
jgi:hypothetical protein